MICSAASLVAEPLVALTVEEARLATRCALDLPALRLDLARETARASLAEGERDAARISLRSLEASGAHPAVEQPDRLWTGVAWGVAAGTLGALAAVIGVWVAVGAGG